MSFSETFDFLEIFYVGYGVYLGVTSVVLIFWVLFARRYRRAVMDSSNRTVRTILNFHYKLVYSLLKMVRPSAVMPPTLPSYRQIFTVAGTTGVAFATVSGIIVVAFQWIESLA